MDYVETDSGSRVHVTSALLGFAAGIAATIIFATYNERRFKVVTKGTRNVSDRTAEYLHGVQDGILGRADHMVDSTRDGIKRASKNARQGVVSATRSVERSADHMADSAHRVIESHMNETGHEA